MIRILKILARSLVLIVSLVFLFIGMLYIWSPVYNFPANKPFAGNGFYNPYQSVDPANWRNSNLHMHSRVWQGLTNGHANSSVQVWDTYSKLGYQTISLSNYQTIDRLNNKLDSYVPVYEHGFGITKMHHLCIGARKVSWLEFPFWQSLHNRQYIIDRLKSQAELVAINHPAFSRGVSPADFSKLAGYDLMEVLNGFRISIPHWDSALSAGRPAFLIANDDAHDVSDPREVGRKFTVYNSPSNKREDLISALRSGCAYGVYMQIPEDETFEIKRKRFRELPVLQAVQLLNGTITIMTSRNASAIRFIGQKGRHLDSIFNTGMAVYKIKNNDTYVRAEIVFADESTGHGLVYYLNPVIRSADGNRPSMPAAEINRGTTRIVRLLSLLALILVFGIYRRGRKIHQNRATDLKH